MAGFWNFPRRLGQDARVGRQRGNRMVMTSIGARFNGSRTSDGIHCGRNVTARAVVILDPPLFFTNKSRSLLTFCFLPTLGYLLIGNFSKKQSYQERSLDDAKYCGNLTRQ